MNFSRRNGNLLVFAVYFVFFCALFWPVVFGGRSFARPDLYPYYYPAWKFACEELLQGRVPLWNPYTGFGTPFAANPQSCLFYPLSAFWFLGDFTRGLNLYIVFHLALAAFSTYFFMRENDASPEASLLSGFAFSLGGYAMSTVRLTISLCSVAYFPLVLVFFMRALSRKEFRWKALCATALLLQFLAGDPAVSAATLGVCFVMGVSHGWRGAAVFAETALLFLALGAFRIVPFAEFIAHSTRAAAGYAAASKWSFPPADLWELVVPQTAALSSRAKEALPWLENAYAGAAAVFFASFCFRRNATPLEKKLFALCAAGTLLALGRYGVVYRLFYALVPFFNLLRFPERFFFLAHFALACLAGLGLARFARGNRLKIFAAGVLVIADLVLANAALPTVPMTAFAVKPENVTVALKEPGLFRVMASPQMLKKAYHPEDGLTLEEELVQRRDQFFPNLPLMDRLHSLWNYESVYLKNVQTVMGSFAGIEATEAKKLWDRWNIRYVASPVENVPGLERVQETASAKLFRNPDAWPRAYVVAETRVEGKGDRLQVTGEGKPASAQVTLYEADRVDVRAEMPEKGWLILSDAFYPGWRVWVDGKERVTQQVEGAFRAVRLETGAHEVVWKYDPVSLWIGVVVSFLALLYLLVRGFILK